MAGLYSGGRRVRAVTLIVVAIAVGYAGVVPAFGLPSRQFIVAEVPRAENAAGASGPVSRSVHEALDGSLLFLANWPLVRRLGKGAWSTTDRYRLLRVAMDGARRFVPPFGGPAATPSYPNERFNVDEVLPLPDGSLLYDDGNTV